MKWYEDQAYVSWQRRDGTMAKYLDRAIRLAKNESEDKLKRTKNEVASAAVQLNSEYAVWNASTAVERQRVMLYVRTIAQISLGIECNFEEAERLKATAAVAIRIFNDVQEAKHWKNVWRDPGPQVEVPVDDDV